MGAVEEGAMGWQGHQVDPQQLMEEMVQITEEEEGAVEHVNWKQGMGVQEHLE
jgi:hypothetical protein